MNEQDMIVEEKIRKREKKDIMLAYILIVILISCILFMLYYKFVRKSDDTNELETPIEYTTNYITLDIISSNIKSRLTTKYNGINSTYNANDNSISINYGDIKYVVPLINNELEFSIDNDNKELSEDIYKEMVATICTYYREDRDGCLNTSRSLNNTNISGVRFINNKVYISVTDSINPSDEVIIDNSIIDDKEDDTKDNSDSTEENNKETNTVQEVNELVE